MVWVDLVEKVTFDQDLKKVRKSKEEHFRQKEQGEGKSGMLEKHHNVHVLKNQCQESHP